MEIAAIREVFMSAEKVSDSERSTRLSFSSDSDDREQDGPPSAWMLL